MTTVYLAGKMSGLTFGEMTAWRVKAENELKKNGFKVLDPTASFAKEKDATPREIVDNNKYQIKWSDIILAELNHNNISIGTIGELVFSREWNKPVIAWGCAKSVINHPWVQEHVTKIFERMEDAVQYIIDCYKK